MFIRFDCGCIGVNIQDEDGRHLVVAPCDSDKASDPINIGCRNMKEKAWTLVSAEDSIRLFDQIGYLVGDGYRLRRIRTDLMWRSLEGK